MALHKRMQGFSTPPAPIVETVVPNPKLRLLDQISEVMRLKHYSIRTERTYADWVRRYVHFHRMKSRAELLPGEPKVEAFLSDLAVRGKVAVSTQNQAFNAFCCFSTGRCSTPSWAASIRCGPRVQCKGVS